MKDTWAAANRMAATDRVRYETSQYHDHRVVLGVFDRLLEELVFCICLLRGAASHKKRLPPALSFNYNNDIHATSNDVTKGLIDLC